MTLLTWEKDINITVHWQGWEVKVRVRVVSLLQIQSTRRGLTPSAAFLFINLTPHRVYFVTKLFSKHISRNSSARIQTPSLRINHTWCYYNANFSYSYASLCKVTVSSHTLVTFNYCFNTCIHQLYFDLLLSDRANNSVISFRHLS